MRSRGRNQWIAVAALIAVLGVAGCDRLRPPIPALPEGAAAPPAAAMTLPGA